MRAIFVSISVVLLLILKQTESKVPTTRFLSLPQKPTKVMFTNSFFFHFDDFEGCNDVDKPLCLCYRTTHPVNSNLSHSCGPTAGFLCISAIRGSNDLNKRRLFSTRHEEIVDKVRDMDGRKLQFSVEKKAINHPVFGWRFVLDILMHQMGEVTTSEMWRSGCERKGKITMFGMAIERQPTTTSRNPKHAEGPERTTTAENTQEIAAANSAFATSLPNFFLSFLFLLKGE